MSSIMIVISISLALPPLGLSSTRTITEMFGWSRSGKASRSILPVTCSTPVAVQKATRNQMLTMERSNKHSDTHKGTGYLGRQAAE